MFEAAIKREDKYPYKAIIGGLDFDMADVMIVSISFTAKAT